MIEEQEIEPGKKKKQKQSAYLQCSGEIDLERHQVL